MTIKWDPKDPNDVDAFSLTWEDRIVSPEVIATSSWVSDPAGLTHGISTYSTNVTTLWLSGGLDGEDYDLTNTITTSAGRTLDQTVRLQVKQR